MKHNILYCVWYTHARRAETLARELHAQLTFIYAARLRRFWLKPLRYLVQAWQTWRLLERERPACVIVQSPPIFAPLAVALWCKLRGGRYIIDCHPGTFYHQQWHWALPILRVLARGAVVSLLCNEDAEHFLQRWQARYLFLPDGLPDLHSHAGDLGSQGQQRIGVISSFAYDEPMSELFEAACLTPQVTYYVTGNPQRSTPQVLARRPPNVVLTGFLHGDAYRGLLHNVQGIMVLSTMPYTLGCGAYEALALARPTILSDLPEQRRLFAHGFLLVPNRPQEIARAVELLLGDLEGFAQLAQTLREEYRALRQPRLEQLQSFLEAPAL
ncbi:MAG TPA: glycosyltransferase [Ktedonobacteraceae bacterium]|jgi:glycosyltransferase involved in cell wall biosynthesis